MSGARRYRQSLWVFGAIAARLSACATSGPDAHGQWALCDIVAHPGAAEGKVVTFHARVESDGIEHTVLIDDACLRQGIVPSDFASDKGSEVSRGIDAWPPGTTGKRIDANWTGAIERDVRMITLRVTDIQGVRVISGASPVK